MSTALHKYLSKTHGVPETPAYPLDSNDNWIIKRTQDIFLSRPAPLPYKNDIGILMRYRFADGKYLLIRLTELFEDDIPEIIANMKRIHGHVTQITGADEQ